MLISVVGVNEMANLGNECSSSLKEKSLVVTNSKGLLLQDFSSALNSG